MTLCSKVLLYIFISNIYASPRQRQPNHRKLLDYNESHSELCLDFYFLNPYEQFLCVNTSVIIWDEDPASYECLTEIEIQTALSELMSNDDSDSDGWTQEEIEYLRQIGTGMELVVDGGTNIGAITYILLGEIFNFSVSYRHWYEDAVPIVAYFEPPHIHLEIYPSDIGEFGTSFSAFLPDDVTGSLNGLQSTSNWALQRSVHDAILKDLNITINGDNAIFLEWWRTYTLDEVIDVMSNTTFLDLPIGDESEDGYYQPCDWDADVCINNTWFPDTCMNNTCTTLFQWLPGYNGDEDRDIIMDYDMRIKMTYIGGEWVNASQNFWAHHLEEETRALWSIWSPTTWTAGGDFVTIGYPTDAALGDGERAYKLIPTELAFRSRFAYDFLLNIIMTNDEYEWIDKQIWDKDWLFDALETRLNFSCQWIKHQINATNDINPWLNWIPNDLSSFMYSCDSYGDTSLQQLWNIDIDDENNLDKLSEYIDQMTAKRILQDCIQIGDTNPHQLLISKVIAIIAGVIQTVFVIIMLYSKNTVLMKTSSVHIILIMLFGGYFGIAFVFLSNASSFIIVFTRSILSQTALILMLTSLTGKTWRLQNIKANALRGLAIKIKDKHIAIRIAIFYIIIIAALIGIQISYPPMIENQVLDHALFIVYRKSDIFGYFETALLLFEIFCFIYVGSLGWKLRSINKKYNESRYIAIILYNTTLFILLIILMNEISMSPYVQFAAESLLWTVVVCIDTSVLLLPKCYHLYRGTHFLEVGLNKQIKLQGSDTNFIRIDRRAPSRKDVQAMRMILKKIGYTVAKRDDKGNVREVSGLSYTHKSSMEKRRSPSKATISALNIEAVKSLSGDGNDTLLDVEKDIEHSHDLTPHTPEPE